MENEKHGRRRRKSISIPIDLMIEILIRLPSKSLVKFKCLSKQYSSIIESRHFVDSFFSCPWNKPRLLLLPFSTKNELQLYSATTTTSTVASLVMTIPGNRLHIVSPPIRGLICFSAKPNRHVICNPTTRQLLHIPVNQTWFERKFCEDVLFGYEPSSNRFKIISLLTDPSYNVPSREHQIWICTVGDGNNSWRKIQDIPYYSFPYTTPGVCINGVLYYLGYKRSFPLDIHVVSFDLKSEKFGLIELPPGPLGDCYLVDFQGKLGIVRSVDEIEVYVLENAEKQQWSYNNLYNLVYEYKSPRVVGICEGEIAFVPRNYYKHGLITTWCFNLDKKTIRQVAIQMPSNHNHNHYHIPIVYANLVENLVSL